MTRVRRLDRDHDMTFGRGLNDIAQGAEAVAQMVRTRLLMLRGEWFLDVDAGVPYLQEFSKKPANIAYAEATLKQTVLSTPGVSSISSWGATFNGVTRRFEIACTITVTGGATSDIRVIR